jgi:hypothetical protein
VAKTVIVMGARMMENMRENVLKQLNLLNLRETETALTIMMSSTLRLCGVANARKLNA